ncbi:hypothetical protein HPB50_018446 [Hyalomma asiaticum]|uniref:Uncharacterized protein n=1 Tax=Hyalomma asiaticum TaxID=266040 RepID=A0ACB7S674_HYAAI|nr:hypothetical protein HPB50_018446 [Hyalomma asiaticum]
MPRGDQELFHMYVALADSGCTWYEKWQGKWSAWAEYWQQLLHTVGITTHDICPQIASDKAEEVNKCIEHGQLIDFHGKTISAEHTERETGGPLGRHEDCSHRQGSAGGCHSSGNCSDKGSGKRGPYSCDEGSISGRVTGMIDDGG